MNNSLDEIAEFLAQPMLKRSEFLVVIRQFYNE